jgi:SAM-dependent methyltransferase
MNAIAPETAGDNAGPDPQRTRFFALLGSSLAQDSFVKLVLAKPRGAEPGLERVEVRRLALKGVDCLSFLYRHATRDITKNLPVPDGVAQAQALLGPSFRNAHLLTASEETQLSLSKRGQCHVTVTRAAQAREEPAPAHNREKQRWIDLSRPFLVELGVTNAQHQLVPAMARKWKQINKFVEVFAHALAASPLADATQVHVADFGSGKGYLTFAVHEWLRHVKGVDAQVIGVELRPDLVRLCNDAAARLGLEGLRFDLGDVRSYAPPALDVMIALHACDVATDHAIHLGIRAGAGIILCSPCCHKQIRPQLLSPHPMRPILQHGVHKDQEAEMVTDSLRALLLEASGYDTQVFEFISLEHTNKNKMILAVKRAQSRPVDAVWAQVRELKQFYGIREQCLETLLAADLARAGSATAT